MGKQKKTLICMYVDDFCGIEEESFNFCIERRYKIEEGKISRKSDEEIEDFPKNFWRVDDSKDRASEANVSAVTLLIGENGAGKTTLMRLLIKWLCQLSAGNFPQEKGALVISVDDKDMLIAFDGGKFWRMKNKENKEDNENKENNEIIHVENKSEIKKLLSDIRLVYYTDTMTDLELSNTLKTEELEFLQDDSLLTRLSNALQGIYTVDSVRVKERIKRDAFKRQMDLFLYSKEMLDYSKDNPDVKRNPENEWEFPIHYMKLTASKAGEEKSSVTLSDGNSKLIEEAYNFWKSRIAGNNNLRNITKALLWGLFSGTIISLCGWERTLPNLEKGIVTEQVRLSLGAYNRYTFYDWNTLFKRFFENLFIDCKREFRAVHRYEEFSTEWNEQTKDNISSFLSALKDIENGDFFNQWVPSENAQNVWEFELQHFNEKDESDQINTDDEKKEYKSLLQEWRCFWENYKKVANLMPECRFDWKYASSGEKNKIVLYEILRVGSDKDKGQIWLLLDEPDNTFHPDWKRKMIKQILEICAIHHEKTFQLLISTHSPIMLSDVPKQAAILLKTREKEVSDKKEQNDKTEENGYTTEKKQQISTESSPFGQQIYTLFNDAFFMNQGIIGAFADEKIGEVYEGLCGMEEQLSAGKINQINNKLEDFKRKLEEYESTIKLIEEPLLHGHLSQSYKLCKQRIERLR